MPTRTKQRRREDNLFKDGWFLLEDLWREPGELPQKSRLLADVNFPRGLVDRLIEYGVEVRTAQQLKVGRHSDKNLLHEAAKRGMTLITLDRDFWSDGKFPLHERGRIAFLEGRDETFQETMGFALLCYLLKSWGGGYRSGKIRVTSNSLYWKMVSFTGKKTIYEIKAIRPNIFVRECDGATKSS